MKRLLVSFVAIVAVACAPGMGDPRPVDVPTVAFRADAGAQAAAVGAAIREANPRAVLLVGPAEGEWYAAVAEAARLRHVSGPAVLAPDLGVAFLGLEAVGDTTIELSYDGGSFIVHDALYELAQRHYLDLLAFQIRDAAEVRPAIAALTEYAATDVMPGAAVVFAVAVPSAAVGDSVARMLSPMYRGVTDCGASPQLVSRSEIRLFYGPEARMYCRSAEVTETAVGDRVRAELVAGRR